MASALLVLLLATGLSTAPAAAKYASIVIDADSGRVLHSVNADTRNYPASLTKMMTLYLAFEALEAGKLRPGQMLLVSTTAAGRSPAKLGLVPGSKISAQDAILALVTKSANDAATVLAEELGGTERRFARLMTRKARALGMNRTTFRNASGLPNRGQLTTARDLAVLSLALIRDFPDRYRLFSTRSFEYRGRRYANHNKLLGSYDGVDGIKTGYIHASGYNLAASARRGGVRLIAVVLGGKTARQRDRLMARLLDKGFGAMQVAAATTPTTTAAAAPASTAAVAAATTGARTIPTPKRRKLVRRVSAWSIQVGAFRRFAQAHLAVTRAARLAPILLRAAEYAISSVKGKAGTLYRARLTGLTQRTALGACRRLRGRNMDCVALPPTGPGVNLASSAP